MNFITIAQYFNRLHSALFLLLIAPLLVFIALYFFPAELPSDAPIEYLTILPSAALLDWFVATIIFNKKIKSTRKAQGLGEKLEKYFGIAVVRYGFFSAASLMMALGFYLTRNDIFTALYCAGLVGSALVWPTSRRVTSHLRLKGDEREMVYFKKDTL